MLLLMIGQLKIEFKFWIDLTVMEGIAMIEALQPYLHHYLQESMS